MAIKPPKETMKYTVWRKTVWVFCVDVDGIFCVDVDSFFVVDVDGFFFDVDVFSCVIMSMCCEFLVCGIGILVNTCILQCWCTGSIITP